MSNTHNFLQRGGSRQFLPEGDILIHSGGFTMNGTDEEYLQFDEWLQSVSDIYHYRVVIAGKRDVKRYGNNWDEVRVSLPHATHVLCHSEATIMGLRIFGSPWHWGHKANYSLRQGAPSFSRFNDIPEGVHVLVTHGPSFGKLDQVGVLKESIGSRDLEENIKRAKPGLHLHGLAAEGRGMVMYPN
jgi:Icc-related predicted phosphoesterase